MRQRWSTAIRFCHTWAAIVCLVTDPALPHVVEDWPMPGIVLDERHPATPRDWDVGERERDLLVAISSKVECFRRLTDQRSFVPFAAGDQGHRVRAAPSVAERHRVDVVRAEMRDGEASPQVVEALVRERTTLGNEVRGRRRDCR